MKQQTIKMIARNPITNKTEEVYPESEVSISEMNPRFWCNGEQAWMSVPDVTAESVYTEWINQVS